MTVGTMDWHTSSTILVGLRDFQNRGAWLRLSDAFRAPIVRFARKLGLAEADAEEVAQETLAEFAAAYRQGRYDRERGRLSRWLFGIAWRQAQNRRRAQARQAARIPVIPGDPAACAELPDEATASHSWDEEWEQALLQHCLARITQEVEPATYQAFRLAIESDEPAQAIADKLGIPVKTVYNAKHRVLKRIRELRAEFEDADAPSDG